MADTKPAKRPKKVETLREKTERVSQSAAKPKARRIRKTASAVGKPFRAVHRFGKKITPKAPTIKIFGKRITLRIHFFPRFLINAFRELRLVQWPTAKQTMRLTWAVFVFSLVFGSIVAVVDFGLDKVFKYVFVK